MDNLWLYIIIFGAIISFAQKGSKQQNAPDNTEPGPVAEDWEKRLRELLGESKAETEQPEGSVPTPQQSHSSTAPVATPVPERPMQHIAHSANRYTASTKPKFKANEGVKPPKQSSNPQVQHIEEQSGNMESILGDFSMEKAVIYAEILKPKYEEY